MTGANTDKRHRRLRFPLPAPTLASERSQPGTGRAPRSQAHGPRSPVPTGSGCLNPSLSPLKPDSSVACKSQTPDLSDVLPGTLPHFPTPVLGVTLSAAAVR